MKKVLVAIAIIVCWSCKERERSVEVIEKSFNISKSFDWLLGDWKRTNEQEGKETFEIWEKVSNKEYFGFGFTIQNSDTIWQENIKLIKGDTAWNFEVTGQGEMHPTIFRIMNIERERFDSENQENEFPKVISYFREGKKLKAVIARGDMEIPFEFVPVNLKNK